jgi:hypothetical protein
MSNVFAPFPSFPPAVGSLRDNVWAVRVNYQVGSRFDAFAAALMVTDLQAKEAATKVSGIVECLNGEYWGISSDNEHRIIEGSWGKGTQTRPPRDVDVIFVLPYDVYTRFESRQGNKQSQLLQEVKETLALDYDTTEMRADGQVVSVKFANGHGVEVVPAFLLQNGKYWICNTRDEGSYKEIDPLAEIQAVQTSDVNSTWTTREFVRMLKRWQWNCGVDGYLKSFQIELVVIDFLKTVTYGLHSRALYDWLVRDFFRYLLTKQNGYVVVPGTGEIVLLGDGWLSRAQTAYDRAVKASAFEEDEMPFSAVAEWQKIFGTDI